MTNLGPVNQIVGLEVICDRSRRTLELKQSAYNQKVLERFRMAESNPTRVPMAPTARLAPNKQRRDGASNNAQFPYREAVGSLMWAVVGTRPDLAYVTNALSQHNENPTARHWGAVKRVLRYLKGTKNSGIVFGPSGSSEIKLEAYSDADYGNDTDGRKSISGYVIYLCGGPISWASRKQRSVARSTMEAEYMAGAGAVSQLIWCRMLLGELGYPQREPSLLNMDNQAAISLAHNTGSQGRAKHIDIQYHFIRDRIASGEIEVRHCPGEDNPADIFTKPLASDKFEKFRDMLGVSASRGSVESERRPTRGASGARAPKDAISGRGAR